MTKHLSESLPIRWKVAGIISLFVATVGGTGLFTVAMFESQKSDALVRDLAGRQRMLHQRHMKEILLAAEQHAVDIQRTREVLTATLSALIDGGDASLIIDGRQLVRVPPAPTREIRNRLLEQRRLAEAFVAIADRFLRLSQDDPGYPEKLEELRVSNESLQRVSNDAVRLFDAHSVAKIYGIVSLEILVAVFVGFVGALLTRRAMEANQELQAERSERRRAEEALKEQTEQLETISTSMSDYLQTGDWREPNARILRSVLRMTESEYGFVGVLVEGPVLRLLAHEGVRWDTAMGPAFHDLTLDGATRTGSLEFRSMHPLSGNVIATGRTVISNDPPPDAWPGALPQGHPPLRHFLGVPLRRGGGVVGMIGVANRPGGYTRLEEQKLRTLIHAAGVLGENYRQRGWFFTSKVPYLTRGGRVLGLIGVAHDITERKRTEEKLRESQANLHRIADAIPGAVYQYALTPSREQRFLYVSRGMQELTGLTAEQVEKDFDLVWALTHPDDAAGLWTSIEESARSLGPWSYEFRILVDGNVKWLCGSSVPEQPRADGTIVWNGILVDVTEQKRAEDELRKSKEKTIAALRESDDLKSALLSSVSHELRTPLAAIKAMVSSAFTRSARASTDVQAEFLEAMNHEVDYLNRLVDNLLDMSRIEAGALVPRREWQLLDEIIEGAIRRLGPDMKGRELELEIADDLPPVYVDAVEIQQVVVNMLDNAVKYSARHSPIRLESLRAGDEVEVRVRNRGEGVPHEDREKIFDRFYRVRSGQAQRIRGTGLGLAICKAIVEAHGGRVWCQSAAGLDTVLAFTIPLSAQPPDTVLDARPCPAGSEA